MGMPDRIWADMGKDGGTFWFSSPHDAFGKQEPYVKADLAQSLADALGFYANKGHVQENVPDADGSVDLCLEDGQIARAALANYRKGE